MKPNRQNTPERNDDAGVFQKNLLRMSVFWIDYALNCCIGRKSWLYKILPKEKCNNKKKAVLCFAIGKCVFTGCELLIFRDRGSTVTFDGLVAASPLASPCFFFPMLGPKKGSLIPGKSPLVGGFNPFSCTGTESVLDACMHHRTKATMASNVRTLTKGKVFAISSETKPQTGKETTYPFCSDNR